MTKKAKKSKKKTKKTGATAATFDGNYVPSSQPGCHVVHYDAPWIIEASDFDPEDYGLEPGQENLVPDMIIDPETKSLRYGNVSQAHYNVQVVERSSS